MASANVGKEILGYPSINQEPTKDSLSFSRLLEAREPVPRRLQFEICTQLTSRIIVVDHLYYTSRSRTLGIIYSLHTVQPQ